MSNTSTSETTSLVCANCGKEGSDVTNTCNKCNSVMYCNAACKKKHCHKYKKECERRVAELHDEKLFKQPPPLEDCPICMLRLPTLDSGQVYMVCCGKVICSGCVHAFQTRITKRKDNICPFCRSPPANSNEETIKRYMKRIELNDFYAMYNMGCQYSNGLYGLAQDHVKALELWYRAGELAYASAYSKIGCMYDIGRGVNVDKKKAIHYSELAAVGGSIASRHNLGVEEAELGNMDRALKHYMIAARGGDFHSLKSIQVIYSAGFITKADFEKALRSYQAYVDEIKSEQRDEAAASREDYNCWVVSYYPPPHSSFTNHCR